MAALPHPFFRAFIAAVNNTEPELLRSAVEDAEAAGVDVDPWVIDLVAADWEEGDGLAAPDPYPVTEEYLRRG